MSVVSRIWSPILPISNAVMAPADYVWNKYDELPQLSKYELPHESYSKKAYALGYFIIAIIPLLLGGIIDLSIGEVVRKEGPFQRAFSKLSSVPAFIVGSLFQLLAKLALYVIPAIFTNIADFFLRAVVGTVATALSAIGLALETAAFGVALGLTTSLGAVVVVGVAAVIGIGLGLVGGAIGIGLGLAVTGGVLYPFYWAGKKLFGSKNEKVISTEYDVSDMNENEVDTYYSNRHAKTSSSHARIRSNLLTNPNEVSNSYTYDEYYNGEDESDNLINTNNNNNFNNSIEPVSSQEEIVTEYVSNFSNKK